MGRLANEVLTDQARGVLAAASRLESVRWQTGGSSSSVRASPHDPHYGKTMRGIIRYGPDPVVAILDSKRAGEEHDGIPIVGTVEDAAPYAPTVAVVGVDAGRTLPPAWRELLTTSIAAGLDVEAGCEVRLRRPRADETRADVQRGASRSP